MCGDQSLLFESENHKEIKTGGDNYCELALSIRTGFEYSG